MKDRYEKYRGPSRGNMRKPRPGTILLLLWGVFLSLAVYGYLAWLQPSRLAATVSHLLESKLDVQCRIGEVSLSFLPVPTIHASNLALLRGSVDNMELHVRRAEIQIGYLSLIRLKPVIRSVSLESPTLDISSDLIQKILDEKKAAKQAEADRSFSLPDLPSGITGVRLHIEDGTCRITGAEGKGHLTVSGINAGARLPGLIPGNLELSVDDLRYTNAAGLELTAADSHISLSSLRRNHRGICRGNVLISTGLQLGSLDKLMGHEISAPYRYFPMPEPLKISLSGGFSASPEEGRYGARGTAEASATLVMNGHPVPISLSVPFDTQDIAEAVDIDKADARMGDDFITISGKMTGLANGNPVLNGRADIHHFSLARWFGFGQAMPSGLQHALDSITGTFEDMELSLHGVVVPRLKAQVQGIDLEGSGSCREFLKPEILISAHAKQADLNRIFPELHGEFPDMSHLPPPVLPLHEDEEDEDSSEPPLVDYDIHISADSADIMNFRVSGADVHVVPSPAGYPMLNILVAGLYGGKATSKVHIDDRIRVTSDLDRVSMDGVTRALAGYPALTGLMKKGSADLSFVPGSGLTMLSSLGGSIRASMEKGSLNLTKSSALPYAALSINAQASAVPGKDLKKLPPSMDFRGSWKVNMDAKDWSVSAEAKQAALSFSTKNGLPTAMRNQPVSLQVTLARELCDIFAKDMKFSVSGKGSYNAENGTVSMADATLRHQDFTLTGNLAATDLPTKLSLTGRLGLSTASFRKCAALFGVSLPDPEGKKVFQKAEADAAVTVTSQELSFDKLNGKIDDVSFSGSLHQSLTGRPSLTGSLNIPSLDIDRYRSTVSGPSSPTSTPLPLSFLKNTDLSLSLSAGRLRAVSTTLTHVSVPVTQKNGTLSAPFKASFPGGGQAEGSFQASLTADGKAADISLSTRCRNMDMMNFSRDRGQKTLIGGTGTFDASLRSRQKHWEDWKRALNGKLSLLVTNGSIVTPSSSNGASGKKESRTDFRTMSMSIALSNGIAACRDFLIKGSPITITGEGTASLAEETINAEATVTLAGIPEMPLTITGNLFSPKITYKLLGAVTGTVGNLGSGVIDLVGGVLSAPFKLFMK